MIRAGRVNATLQFVETKRNFGSLSVAFTFSLQRFWIFFTLPVDNRLFRWYYIRANSDGPLAQLAEQLTLNQWV